MSRNSTGLHPGLHSGHSVASVSVVAFGGGARYGVRRQVFFVPLQISTHGHTCHRCVSWSHGWLQLLRLHELESVHCNLVDLVNLSQYSTWVPESQKKKRSKTRKNKSNPCRLEYWLYLCCAFCRLNWNELAFQPRPFWVLTVEWPVPDLRSQAVAWKGDKNIGIASVSPSSLIAVIASFSFRRQWMDFAYLQTAWIVQRHLYLEVFAV